jgi:chemotaxis protein MotA
VDFATLIGLVGAMMLIASAVILGVSPDVFLNVPALLIVIGGGFGQIQFSAVSGRI